MRHWEIAFTGNWPAALVLAGGAAAAALAWAFYSRKRAVLPPRVFAALTTLRLLALGVVTVFLLQPVLRLVRTEARQAVVAVAVDASESMGIRDAADERSRLEAAVGLLTGPPHDVLRGLARSHSVRLFAFGAITAELDDGARLAELRPDRKATAVGEALRDVAGQVPREDLAGIVLLTDGVSTRGDAPGSVAPTLGVPVFPVALGGRLGARGRFWDVGIARVPRSGRYIVNNRAIVKVVLSCAGLQRFAAAERRLTLRLWEGERELASAPVGFPAEDGVVEQELSFTPDRVGVHRLRVALSALPAETVTENNERSFTVQVTDPRIRVLIVEGVVRPEYRFLRRVLESDPNLEVTGVVKLSGARFMVQGVDPGVDLSRGLPAAREHYAKFDVVILGDIAREEFSGLQLDYLKEFVADGGALIALGGYHAFGPGGYADGPVADLLPVTMGGERDGHVEEPFVPVLTPAGRQHPIFEGTKALFESPDERTALDGANRLTGAKPGAQVLAVHDTERAGGRPMPVVAVQDYSAGRTMALAADTTWKWRFQIEAAGLDSPYCRFWRQALRWLAGRKEEEPAPGRLVSAWTPRVEYEPGERVLLKARVKDAEGQPEQRARVAVKIEYPIPIKRRAPDGAEAVERSALVQLEPQPLSLGEYQLPYDPPAAGLYRASAAAYVGDEELDTDEFEFVVGQAATEFERVDVNEQVLRLLAGQTGGAFHTLATAGRIPQELEERRRLVARRREVNLWNAPWCLAVFLACVTAEWVLRKRHGLN